MSVRRPVPALALATAALAVALAGCAPTVSLDPGANANDPGCAEISVRLPDTVAGNGKRVTDAQATGAWGDPTSVILRCGVPEIGPTTQPCVTVNGVDWVLMTEPDATTIVYQTFGRTPATEVVIDHVAGVSDSAVLPEFASAVAAVAQTKQCLSMLDTGLTPAGTETGAPTDSPLSPADSAPTR